MGKVSFTPNVDTNVTGKATASGSQERSLNGAGITYNAGHGYYVPVQWLHTVASQVEGFNDSKRVFAAEVKLENGKLVPTGITTAIKASSIMQTYLAMFVEGEDAPKINCELNDDGLMRPKSGEAAYNQCTTGPKCIRVNKDTKEMQITAPIVYWFEGASKVYTPSFDKKENGYDMLVNDDDEMQFETPMVNFWRTQPASNFKLELTLQDIVPADTPHLEELIVAE